MTISGFSRFGEGPAFTPRLSRELIEPPLCERQTHESFDPRLGFELNPIGGATPGLSATVQQAICLDDVFDADLDLLARSPRLRMTRRATPGIGLGPGDSHALPAARYASALVSSSLGGRVHRRF